MSKITNDFVDNFSITVNKLTLENEAEGTRFYIQNLPGIYDIHSLPINNALSAYELDISRVGHSSNNVTGIMVHVEDSK